MSEHRAKIFEPGNYPDNVADCHMMLQLVESCLRNAEQRLAAVDLLMTPTIERPTKSAEELDNLSELKGQRDALDVRISLIERGIEKAAYDAGIRKQLLAINDSLKEEGKAPLTMGQFFAGMEEDDD
jgi:hypothetical protein